MPKNYRFLQSPGTGFSQFVGANVDPDRTLAVWIQSKGEKGWIRKSWKKVKLKLKNKKTQKIAAATVVVAGVASAPFTGGLSAVASISVAIALWAAGKGIQKAIDKLKTTKTPDMLKGDYKSAIQHLENAIEHRNAIQDPGALAANEVEAENGQGRIKYNPNVGLELFMWAHHVHKAEMRIDEIEQTAQELRRMLDQVKEDEDNFTNQSWNYVHQTFIQAQHLGMDYQQYLDPSS